MLTDEQLKAFDNDGAVTVDTPLTDEQVQCGSNAIDELLPPVNDDEGKPKYRRGHSEVEHADLLSIWTHPFFENVSKQYLRADDVVLFQSYAIISDPEPPREVTHYDEHVDTVPCLTDFDVSPRRMTCSFFLWLNDVTPTRAAFQYRPGSHLILAKRRQAELMASDELPVAQIKGESGDAIASDEYADLVTATAKAGQVTALTSGVVHRATYNQDTQPRKTLVMSYRPKDVPVMLPKQQQQRADAYYPKLFDLLPTEKHYLIPQASAPAT